MMVMMMMTLHHGLAQITACLKALLSAGPRWCSVDSRASVTPHTLAPAGQEAAKGNLDEGEEWIPTAWDPIRCSPVLVCGRKENNTVQEPQHHGR
jgi:hypothetical protein